jgi:glucose/arabinose dehydrogenase
MYVWDSIYPMKVIAAILLALSLSQLAAQTLTPADIVLETFYTGANVPVGVYNCGDHRLFILEQNQADIEIIDTTGQYIGKFIDLSTLASTGGERGLLGLAFHPNYNSNGFFFVNYTNNSGNTVIARYSVSADVNVADPSSAITVLTINQPYSNHNGGHIAFGPDGYLYIGMGDGGSGGDPEARSQNPQTLLGKMLRINVDALPYSIPNTNPYFGQSDTLPEIWALGLRNPWKFSFDASTGDMWIGDVGQNLWEEINYEPSTSGGGLNWGWRCYEGNATYNTTGCGSISNYDFPVKVHAHNEGFCSITGGVVYRGAAYPALEGVYFYSDFCDGDIFSLEPNGSGGFSGANLVAAGNGVVAFGEDAAGEVYIAKTSNIIYKVHDSCPFYPQLSTTVAGQLDAGSGSSYWWYRNGEIIAGAQSQAFVPTEAGSYFARVSNGTCTRQTNTIDWIVLGGVGGCTYGNATNYNAAAQVDDGSCLFSVNCDCPADLDVDGVITVQDLLLFLVEYGTLCND